MTPTERVQIAIIPGGVYKGLPLLQWDHGTSHEYRRRAAGTWRDACGHHRQQRTPDGTCTCLDCGHAWREIR